MDYCIVTHHEALKRKGIPKAVKESQGFQSNDLCSQ